MADPEQSPLLPSSTDSTSATSLPTVSLYISHALSTWNSRVFEYAAVLFLTEIIPGSLAPSSWYALGRAGSVIVASRQIGNYIDSSPRLPIIRKSIVYQRIAVIISCGILFLMLRASVNVLHAATPGLVFSLQSELLIVLIFLACIERLAAMMNLIVVERDWVVVIAGGNIPLLTKLNSQMRRIDLFCKMVGPLTISLIISFTSVKFGIWVVLVTNLLSVGIEYWAIARVYHRVPTLALKTPQSHRSLSPSNTSVQAVRRSFSSWLTPFVEWSRHAMFLPSLTLSLLYFTVLSFGGQMIVFLLYEGFDTAHIGWLRTLSVILELSATFSAPWLMSKIGAIRTGRWFINWQSVSVVFAVVFFCYFSDRVGLWGLIAGVILSRVGLWGFDLAVQVQIQNGVEETKRARFSSTETAIQSIFDLLSFAATIVCADPKQFKIPAIVSAAAVCISAVLYSVYVYRAQKL
ncbi:hypothetical protein NADFUDRAFT_49007 [Nadsonia fulvescens var. elongata DSM 6958]|uniref:Solute carrier family 40 member n=1 Tax=Nadsonia fulvescens var. elongata DSM 6958 TaxID=857566 RepID=A0A1E3PTU9_9ASCO|nr:hypothetical protein NADFUDRAFT_49007 [Nadsonia fulvescens var. elongata DSM 6958]